ncbi:reverse transcriptase domain-containing protein [Tanacetum coccineum]
MTPIYEYHTEEILLEEKMKARAIRRKAGRYVMTNRILYKRFFLGPWLRCVGLLQANYVLRETHERCQEVDKRVQKLSGSPSCAKEPAAELDPHHIPVAILQFKDNPFKDWCKKLCIRQCFASVKHPQANGLVERANKSLGEGIKAQLDERSKNWLEEISHVLWAHRTMIKSSNGEMPFSLMYGMEAVIPVEIGMPTLRTAKVDMIKNDEALEINLDLLEERREQEVELFEGWKPFPPLQLAVKEVMSE